MAFVEGLITGLGMVVFIGPVFFTLLQTTLQYGFRSGFFVALGIFISDVICVSLCYFGASAFFRDPQNEFWIGIVGSIILFVLGIGYLFKKSIETEVPLEEGAKKGFVGFMTKGFLVNFVNPFVFAIWITISAYARNQFDQGYDQFIYLAVALLVILSTDILKALLAHKIKRFINPKLLKRVYRVIGLLLILFGARILYYVVWNL